MDAPLIVPIGGGGGGAGRRALTVAGALNPAIQVIGIQSRRSPLPAIFAWKAGRPGRPPTRR